MNLPKLAIEAKGEIGEFIKLLDKYMNLAKDYLEERYNLIAKKHVYNFPFILGNKIYMGSENLKKEDTIEKVLQHSTLSIGFCGLAEALVALTGKHHGESDEAQQLGLIIIAHMRAMTDTFTNKTHMNWSLFGTPAESTAGKFAKLCRKQYGIIPGVTDKEFQTNSSHIPVYYPIKAIDKIRKEAPYHELCNAGHIMYLEFDGDATKNLEAFETAIRAMHDNNAGYFAINTKSADYCPICGNASFINDSCPICGYNEHVDEQHYKVELVNN